MMLPGSPGGDAGRPPRWPVLLAISTLISGVLGNVASNALSDLAGSVLGSASLALAVAGGIASVLFEVRRRRAERLNSTEPTETVSASSTGAPTLPYPAGFTGRAEQISAIVDAVKREHAVAVVGRRAVGTSSCAVQAANVCRDDYPDGQFYLDLRGRDRRRSTRDVLAALARILGTTPPRSGRPDDLTTAAEALRGHLDGKRILLVLDNVDDPAQVWPLLPPTARTCRLLLAGAPTLANLNGVVSHWLSEPDQDDAVELFAAAGGAASGTRTRRPDPRTDPAVREIVELCGRQPRTIRALGYRAARHGWRSTELLSTLRQAVEAPPHQGVPHSPAVQVLTDRDTAYAALSGGAKRLYRLMSLSPVALDRPTIAALARRRPERVAALLDELAGAFVVGAPGDRYEIRPLLTGYARLHLRAAEPAWRRVTAQARLARHLARRAERHAASLAVTASLTGREPSLPLDDDPAGWFDLNQELLLAVVKVPAGAAETLPRRVRRWWFRVAVALCGWYAHEERLDEWAEVCRMVLDTPTAEDRPEIAGWAHNELGVLRRRQHDPQGALDELTVAVAKRGRRGAAQARMNLGLAQLDLGQLDQAIEQLELSRRHRSTVDRAGHALTNLGLGAAHLARNEPETAHHHLVKAANTFRSIGEARGYAAALTNLVLVHSRLGEHLDAAQAWRAALREYDTVADLTARATALLNAGATLLTTTPARAGQAYELLAEGRRLRERWRPTAGLGRTLLYLGDAAQALGRADEARRHWDDAAGVCEAVRDAAGLAAAEARPLGEEDHTAK
jgi:tetratricopeptide (TPR) repeat protein